MKSKEALNEIKNYPLVSYDENGEEDDCITFGELEPNLIEPIEKDIEKLSQYEDIEEFCEKVTKEKVYHKLNTTDGTIISCDTYENCYVLYNFKTKEIELYSNYYDLFDCSFKIDEYGKTWSFIKKDLEK